MVTGLSANLAERESFEVDVAPGLAQQLPGQLKAEHHRSKVFSYFGDSNRLVLIAGAQSEHAAWALVYGSPRSHARRSGCTKTARCRMRPHLSALASTPSRPCAHMPARRATVPDLPESSAPHRLPSTWVSNPPG
jgi:hypothetical protein